MITPTTITPPIKEPVSLAEAQAALHVASATDNNTLLTLYISAARRYYEWRTSRTVHQTTLEYALDYFPAMDQPIRLPRATPLITITSVIYTNSAGTPATMTATTDYIPDTDSLPGRVVLTYGKSWPSFTPYPMNAVRIRYVAGIATTSPVTEADADVKLPILLLVGGMWENREGFVVSDGALSKVAIDYGIEAFIGKQMVEYGF
jgi:uncharacterized phiE125 gp8 family phage protein